MIKPLSQMIFPNFELFQSFLDQAKVIVITTHIIPDADGLGSQLALKLGLAQLGKKTYAVNEKSIPSRFHFIAPPNSDSSILSYDEFILTQEKTKIDLVIVVDTHSHDRVGERMRKLINKAKHFIFIDHHPAPTAIKTLHCIDTSYAATGEFIYFILKKLQVKLNESMARALYSSILIDTSSFRYPTVSSQTHNVVAELIDLGIRPSDIYNEIYGTKSIDHFHFLGEVLSRSHYDDESKLAWMVLPHQSFEKYSVTDEDTHSFVNYLLVLNKIRVACMFRETSDKVKMSLRTSLPEIDVGEIAKALGGGGHNHSAAANLTFEKDLKTTVNSAVKKIILILKNI